MPDESSNGISCLKHQDGKYGDSLDFVYNDPAKETKVITTLSKNLKKCDSFDFSVAFVSMSGITALLNELRPSTDGSRRNRILTTDYLNFNDPKALRKLLKFKGIDVRIFTKENFHTKAYIFNKDGKTTALVGSSNLTAEALCHNKEWNLKLTSMDASILDDIRNEFESMWNDAETLTEKWIDDYIPRYEKSRKYYEREKAEIASFKSLSPNMMQKDALKNLQDIRNSGKDRALIVSATGTGKTYLSAFDVKNFGPKRVLFLVHRDKILSDAMYSYKKVLGQNISAGKLTGSRKDFESDYLFATTQSMALDNNLFRFEPDHFDYIVCDEAHHSSANQYTKIIDYFKPKFLLGMTATPERTDAKEIFSIFDYNIACDIRLRNAMEFGMVCPFHYFGITDITVNGELLDEDADFNALTSDERVNHLLEEAEYYGYSGSRLRGLIFCSSVKECYVLSEILNKRGLRTVALSGKSTDEERESAIDRLEGDHEGGLDYVLTYDIFNEGIDIPSVNQVIMLRPTESAIVFVQQLGRGLRKRDDLKKYLVVLDFIGNYKSNFLIAVALSGDKSCIKDNLRRFMHTGNASIPGISTINFDEISKEKIFTSISESKISAKSYVRNGYQKLIEMNGRPMSLSELYIDNGLDPRAVITAFGSLNELQSSIKYLKTEKLGSEESKAIKIISSGFISGIRAHELVILRELMRSNSVSRTKIIEILEEEYSIDRSDMASLDSAISVLDSSYRKGSEKFVEMDGEVLIRSDYFDHCLRSHEFRSYAEDAVECGLIIFSKEYKNQTDGAFKLYERYTRMDVVRLLNWDQYEIPLNIGGYKIKSNAMPIFITYNKDENISSVVEYKDAFIDPGTMQWMSKHSRTMESPEIKRIIGSDEAGISNYLFVKRSDSDDNAEFYYLGRVHVKGVSDDMDVDEDGKEYNVVKFKLGLEHPVRNDIYEYLKA
ncbi:MAG: DEAD/DEAH box helicase [Methanosarcina mazei]|jgi:superfamily II DNA or RNA helicase|nr:DEAD/DEAH box helicase [Methanosarcina mazei]